VVRVCGPSPHGEQLNGWWLVPCGLADWAFYQHCYGAGAPQSEERREVVRAVSTQSVGRAKSTV
jgi:hypothetical protein